MKECSWCSNYFEPATSYQIYCGPECRKDATKQKIKDRGRAAVLKKRAKQLRLCVNCQTALSIYNDSKICSKCNGVNNRLVDKALKDMQDYFDYEDKT